MNEPFHCRDEVIGTNLPDVSGECGLLLLIVIELLDRFDLPCPFVGKGLYRGIEGGPILSDTGLQVDSAACIKLLGFPLEVDFLT